MLNLHYSFSSVKRSIRSTLTIVKSLDTDQALCQIIKLLSLTFLMLSGAWTPLGRTYDEVSGKISFAIWVHSR